MHSLLITTATARQFISTHARSAARASSQNGLARPIASAARIAASLRVSVMTLCHHRQRTHYKFNQVCEGQNCGSFAKNVQGVRSFNLRRRAGFAARFQSCGDQRIGYETECVLGETDWWCVGYWSGRPRPRHEIFRALPTTIEGGAVALDPTEGRQ